MLSGCREKRGGYGFLFLIILWKHVFLESDIHPFLLIYTLQQLVLHDFQLNFFCLIQLLEYEKKKMKQLDTVQLFVVRRMYLRIKCFYVIWFLCYVLLIFNHFYWTDLLLILDTCSTLMTSVCLRSSACTLSQSRS